MNFQDLVRKNLSYRGYDESRRLTRAELEGFVECARLSPSSVNAQPFRYYLAWEKREVDQIQALTKWARGLPELTLPHPGHCPTGFVVICQDTRLGESLQRYLKDVGIVAQTMLLAATEQGLGGCMIGNFNGNEVKAELGLPEYLVPMLLVAFGKPDETVVLTEVGEGGSTKYYRDEQDVHYVPKRRLEDIVLTKGAI